MSQSKAQLHHIQTPPLVPSSPYYTPILNLHPSHSFHNPKTQFKNSRLAMAIDAITSPSTAHKALATLFSLSKIPNSNKLSLTKPLTISQSMMQETIENARTLIHKWDPTSPSLQKFTSLFQENRDEAQEFIKSVDGLRRAMHFLITERPCSDQLVVANNLMKTAMLRLEKEFYYIISTNRDCLNPESVSTGSSVSRSLSFSNSEEEETEERVAVAEAGDENLRVDRALSQLKMIADSMISSGYSKECGKIYRITRKSIVDEELYRLGIRSYSPSQIMRLDHGSLRNQVNQWIGSAKTAVRSIFHGEKLMCDHVFAISETIKQTCMAHTTMEGALNLLRFPEIVAQGKRSSENIILLVNLFETISDLWPEIEAIFSCEALSPVILQAMASIQKLRESAQTILSEFISSIQKNSSKTPLPGGGVHPLTYRVMDYIALLADNAATLSGILAADDEAENNNSSPFPGSYVDIIPNDSGLASRLAWIVLVLLCKLDSKAELYKDIGLSYLFLANNLQIIVDRVGATSLRHLLGEEWLAMLRKKVKLYAAKYESVAWGKVLACLPAEAESSPTAIKEQFRKFNAAFEAAYRKQSAWSVPDPKLRDEIKVSIARKVVPAYRQFYDSCYLAILSEERNLEVLVRFSPDNLGNYLSDLFHKTPPLTSQSKSGRCL